MATRYVPDSGDIVWLAFDPQAGHEQAGHRPALVLSPAAYNAKTGLMVCCPMSTKIKGYPFEVVLPAGLAVTGAILSDQVKSLDWRARNATFICTLPAATVAAVLQKLNTLVAPITP